MHDFDITGGYGDPVWGPPFLRYHPPHEVFERFLTTWAEVYPETPLPPPADAVQITGLNERTYYRLLNAHHARKRRERRRQCQ